jgi:hypothetical protein
VKNRFQNLPFKCNLQHYTKAELVHRLLEHEFGTAADDADDDADAPDADAADAAADDDTFEAFGGGATADDPWETGGTFLALVPWADALNHDVDGRGLSLAYNRPRVYAPSQLCRQLF